MSSAVATASLQELTFPDCTQKTIGAFITVTFNAGTYTTGGIPFGLVLFADARTVDFNGFLTCTVEDETPQSGQNYTFKYVPSTDTLRIYFNGTELASNTSVTITDSVIAHAIWDRTTVRG